MRWRFKVTPSSTGAPAVSLRTTLKGFKPYNEVGPLRDRRMHALALGIAAVCYRDIARSEGEMLERFAVWTSLTNTLRNCKETKSIARCRR